jgi:protein TonB
MLIPKFDLYKSEWLELVFENRNKAYGAYDLRQHYGQTMTKAIVLVVSGFIVSGVALSFIYKVKDVPAELVKTTVVDIKDIKVVLPPPPKMDKPLPKQAAPLKVQPSVPTVVIPTHITDKPVTTEPPVIATLTGAIGSVESKGEGKGENAPVEGTPSPGNGSGVANNVNNNVVVDYAEVSPEPAGGMAGWAKFIQRNLRYPDTDAQGRVFVSFVVERDGSLSNVKILRSVSPELDAEALRVIRMAPKWKPGKQGGQPVRVQFNIPINFQQSN